MVHTVRNRVLAPGMSSLAYAGVCDRTGVDGCSLSSQTGLLLSLELGLHERTGGVRSCDQGPSSRRRATVSPESRFSSPSSDTTMAACLFYPVDVANPTRPSTACAREHGEGAPLLPGLCVQNRKC